MSEPSELELKRESLMGQKQSKLLPPTMTALGGITDMLCPNFCLSFSTVHSQERPSKLLKPIILAHYDAVGWEPSTASKFAIGDTR